jgi:hypothetical protein
MEMFVHPCALVDWSGVSCSPGTSNGSSQDASAPSASLRATVAFGSERRPMIEHGPDFRVGLPDQVEDFGAVAPR